MGVSILDSWLGDNTYATQDASFSISNGYNRLALVFLTAEDETAGTIDVNTVSIGDKVLTQIAELVVDAGSGFRNLLWAGYLLEADIISRVGSTITILYNTAPSNPFDEPMIFYASYQGVDQSNPIASSSTNTVNAGTSIQAGAVAIGQGDQLVYCVMASNPTTILKVGQNPEYRTTVSFQAGEPVNGHSAAVFSRNALKTNATANPATAIGASSRLAAVNVVLNWEGKFLSKAPFVLSVEENTSTALNTTHAVTMPESRYRDMLYVAIANTLSATDPAASYTPPSGWTEIFDDNISAASAVRLAIYRKRAVVTEAASYTWTPSASCHFGAISWSIRGDVAEVPDIISAFNTGVSASPSSPTVTTTVANTLVMRIFANDDVADISGVEATAPANHRTVNFIGIAVVGGDNGAGLGVAVITQAAAGASGAGTWTLNASEEWGAVTIAVRGTGRRRSSFS